MSYFIIYRCTEKQSAVLYYNCSVDSFSQGHLKNQNPRIYFYPLDTIFPSLSCRTGNTSCYYKQIYSQCAVLTQTPLHKTSSNKKTWKETNKECKPTKIYQIYMFNKQCTLCSCSSPLFDVFLACSKSAVASASLGFIQTAF